MSVEAASDPHPLGFQIRGVVAVSGGRKRPPSPISTTCRTEGALQNALRLLEFERCRCPQRQGRMAPS